MITQIDVHMHHIERWIVSGRRIRSKQERKNRSILLECGSLTRVMEREESSNDHELDKHPHPHKHTQ